MDFIASVDLVVWPTINLKLGRRQSKFDTEESYAFVSEVK